MSVTILAINVFTALAKILTPWRTPNSYLSLPAIGFFVYIKSDYRWKLDHSCPDRPPSLNNIIWEASPVQSNQTSLFENQSTHEMQLDEYPHWTSELQASEQICNLEKAAIRTIWKNCSACLKNIHEALDTVLDSGGYMQRRPFLYILGYQNLERND